MKKYLIILKEKNNIEFLDNYKTFDIEIHMGLIVFVHMSEEDALDISKKGIVESIEEDGEDSVDSSLYSDSQTSYNFNFMEIEKFHEEGYKGKGFKVGILDTGVQKHVNLKISGGVNAFNNSVPYDANLRSSHGTRVAGVVNAQGIDGNIIGVAPEAELYAIRIDDGTGGINRTVWSSQIAGMSWAVENDLDAVNCSFSSPVDSLARKKAFELAHESGLAIFCSGGNNQISGDVTTHTTPYPARYPFTISTANIKSDKTRNANSSIGRGLNFSNGGTSIKSTSISSSSTVSNTYATGSGTSYASPATMGLYILYKQKYGGTREKILQRMSINAEKLGDSLWYGAGIPKYPTINYENIQIRG